MNKTKNKISSQKIEDKSKKRILTILFFLAIACIFIPLYLAKGIAAVNELIPDFTKYLWVYYLFIPIPIVSLILGIKYKKIVYSCTKNIISGIIIIVLLIILGSFSFIFYDLNSDNYEQIITLGEILDIDFPEKGKCNIKEEIIEYKNTQISRYGLIIFPTNDTEDFEESVANDGRWLKELNSNLQALKTGMSLENGDYHLFYNETLNAYNELPTKSGIYKIHYLSYDVEKHVLFMTTYDITYIA